MTPNSQQVNIKIRREREDRKTSFKKKNTAPVLWTLWFQPKKNPSS